MRIRHLLPCWRPMLRLSESRQCSSGSNALQFNDIRATAKRPPEPARVRQKAISRCTHSAHDARQPIENKCEPAQLIMAQTQRPFSNDRFAALSDLRALCSMCHNGLAADLLCGASERPLWPASAGLQLGATAWQALTPVIPVPRAPVPIRSTPARRISR